MLKQRNILSVLFFLTPFFADAAALDVLIPQYGINLSYEQPNRLEQVLTDTNTLASNRALKPPYWLATQLIEPQRNEEIFLKKEKVLEKLQFLASSYPSLSTKANSLRALIVDHEFNYRHFSSLDKDMIRLKPELNPLLDGYYQILVSYRSTMIYVVGGMTPLIKNDYVENRQPKAYLSELNLPDKSEVNHLFVIQPDGQVLTYYKAYWQQNRMYLAPGAIIFTGFKSLPQEYASLNQQIADLLRFMEPIQ